MFEVPVLIAMKTIFSTQNLHLTLEQNRNLRTKRSHTLKVFYEANTRNASFGAMERPLSHEVRTSLLFLVYPTGKTLLTTLTPLGNI